MNIFNEKGYLSLFLEGEGEGEGDGLFAIILYQYWMNMWN